MASLHLIGPTPIAARALLCSSMKPLISLLEVAEETRAKINATEQMHNISLQLYPILFKVLDTVDRDLRGLMGVDTNRI
ncbi:hypothetical protein ACFX19_044202 [Malus domestica]